ncbi:MAG: transcriptional repressor [Lentisphaerae bacterium]|nr:transcriptional repressor [Lentisphaerota bacterium]
MQECAAYLRSLGVSPSPQRVAIYDFLKKNPVHPTVDTIYQSVLEQLPAISRTTVYNTVKRLVLAGAIQEVIIEDGELRFDANIKSHAHFKCMECGKVYDLFPPEGVAPVEKIHGLPDGFQVTQIHLCCRGRCQSCSSILES